MTISILFLIGRVVLGLYFLENAYSHFAHVGGMAGYAASKGVPAPKVAVIGSGILLLVGGVSFILGLWPSIGVAAIVLFLIGVTPALHNYWKESDPSARMMSRINFMKNWALMAATLMLLAIPTPWVWSVSF